MRVIFWLCLWFLPALSCHDAGNYSISATSEGFVKKILGARKQAFDAYSNVLEANDTCHEELCFVDDMPPLFTLVLFYVESCEFSAQSRSVLRSVSSAFPAIEALEVPVPKYRLSLSRGPHVVGSAPVLALYDLDSLVRKVSGEDLMWTEFVLNVVEENTGLSRGQSADLAVEPCLTPLAESHDILLSASYGFCASSLAVWLSRSLIRKLM
eukprot:Rmarinus@m.540